MLAEMGAEVVIACRSMEKAEGAVKWIKENSSHLKLKLVPMKLDLGDLKSVVSFSKEFKKSYNKLNVLVNNAGTMRISSQVKYTKDGLEEVMGVNHVGPFLLTNELLDLLRKEGKNARIINVSSYMHHFAAPDFVDEMFSPNVFFE